MSITIFLLYFQIVINTFLFWSSSDQMFLLQYSSYSVPPTVFLLFLIVVFYDMKMKR